MLLLAAAAAAVTLLVAPSGIPPEHLAELDVYHVNPPSFSDTPLDMNTGDDAGDMFFNLQSTFAPILCRNRSSPLAASLTCKNAETNAPDLVVTKLRLAVDRRFGGYQLCNICVDGHDPIIPPFGGFGPPPPPPGTPPTLSCLTSFYPGAAALANCTGPPGSYCYKLRTTNTTMLQGCDAGGICSRFSEPAGQCFGMPNPSTGVPVDVICSAPGADTLPPSLNPSDFETCPLITPSNMKHPLGRNCTTGEYLCDCPAGNCQAIEVGAENITLSFGPGSAGAMATAGQIKALEAAGIEVPRACACSSNPRLRLLNNTCLRSVMQVTGILLNMSSWYVALADKLGGMWYSTTRSGMCSADDAPCSWRLLETVKRVTKTCSDDSIYRYIEGRDSSGCFSACPQPLGGARRNTSDECWVRCLFVTVLGPASGGDNPMATGLSREEMLEAWGRPFASDDPNRGGCPALALPPAAAHGGSKAPAAGHRAVKWLLVSLLCVLAAAVGVAAASRLLCQKGAPKPHDQEVRLLDTARE